MLKLKFDIQVLFFFCVKKSRLVCQTLQSEILIKRQQLLQFGRTQCESSYYFGTEMSQPANIDPQDVPWTFSSNVPRTSPKDAIWPSQERLNLTSWGCPEMMSRGRPNLTFKGRPSEVDSGHSRDVFRTFPRGSSEYSNLNVPAFVVSFLSKLIRLTKSI